jgi:hypothetical protein
MSSYRCAAGCESWPSITDYKTCPICGEPTSMFSDIDPISQEEARSIKRRIEFEEYYEDWDDKHDPIRLMPTDEDFPWLSLDRTLLS